MKTTITATSKSGKSFQVEITSRFSAGLIETRACAEINGKSVWVELSKGEGVVFTGSSRDELLDFLGVPDVNRAALLKNPRLAIACDYKDIVSSHKATIQKMQREYQPRRVVIINDGCYCKFSVSVKDEEADSIGGKCNATEALQSKMQAISKDLRLCDIDMLAPFHTKTSEGDYSVTNYFEGNYAEILTHLETFSLQIADKDQADTQAKAEKEAARQAFFAEAAYTGKPVVIESYTTFRPWANGEGETQITVTRYAMPNRTEKITSNEIEMS